MGAPGSIPGQGAFVLSFSGLTGAMVARLPTEQEVVGSIPTLGLGVFSVLVAQLADRPLHTRKAQGSIPCENLVGVVVISRKVER